MNLTSKYRVDLSGLFFVALIFSSVAAFTLPDHPKEAYWLLFCSCCFAASSVKITRIKELE